MQPRPLANPPNPYSSTDVEWLEAPPPTQVHVYEDHTKNILAKNDSPDVGFTWSINPYRGCQHACAYCLSGDTPILMADGRTKPLADVRVGDEIYGTERRGFHRHYVRTRVLDHWRTEKPAWRIRLEDGTELIASGDHRFLSNRGWKYVTGPGRPFLTTRNKLMGTGGFAPPAPETADYRRGYVAGIARRSRKTVLLDLEAVRRARQFQTDVTASVLQAVGATAGLAIGPDVDSDEWTRGFLAGVYDADGERRGDELRFAHEDASTLARAARALVYLGFECIAAPGELRLRGGLAEHLRFFHTVDPAITRKRDLAGEAVKSEARLGVVAIEPLGVTIPMFDITTGTGDFIANGVVSHNCYARPTHEYLSFGAGTDFDTKIVVKPHAPELLREAFEKKSWKGELIMFSGNTDCYQPLEASYRLTRGLLEVCAEYANPAHIITKAPLVERDIDVLQRLKAVTHISVTISIPFWDADRARAVEPWVATPQRRVRAVERLAAAGIPVGVNVAPIVPGLGDEDMVKVLEAAAAAGAKHAGIVLLRLPGNVKQVFEERMRAAFPLRADKILHRIRDTRGGKLYDSSFGSRQVGEGQYADTIQALFDATCRRLGLNQECKGDEEMPDTFRRPPKKTAQLALF